jgi:hypothetical protein
MAQARTARPSRRIPAPRRHTRLRVPTWLTVLTAALLVAGAVAIAVAVSQSPSQSRSAAPTAASVARLTAYQSAIVPTLQAAGGMVEQEIKPSIASLEGGSLTAAELRSRAASWRTRFEQARASLAKVTVPAGLAGAAAGFDQAFQRYDDAVTALASVPDSATGNANPTQVQNATNIAAQADQLYDRASAIIQANRRAAGLGPTVDLPDPTPTAAG